MAERHGSDSRRRPLWPLLVVVVLLGVGILGWTFQDDLLGLVRADPDPPLAAPTAGPTSPSPSPSPSPTPPPRGRLLIHGTGDVSLDPSYIPNLVAEGWGYAWSGLDGLFEEDDLTVVNLECAVSDLGAPVPKKFNFRGDPESLPAMRRAGVEVANLGNNHAYDFGPEALLETIENLEGNDIAPVGAGANPREAFAPARFALNGWRVAVLGFDQVVDPYPTALAAPGHPGTSNGLDPEAMLRAIEWADRRADLVIVTIHWGMELDTLPRPEQVELGHRFVNAGADVIFGHHAHRLQPVDHYNGKPIFWSLGNFVWPTFSAEGSITAVAEVTVKRDGTVRGRLLPVSIEAAGHPVLTG